MMSCSSDPLCPFGICLLCLGCVMLDAAVCTKELKELASKELWLEPTKVQGCLVSPISLEQY